MIRVLLVVALVWLALMPPLFTDGACTAEFDREAARLQADQKSLMTPSKAAAYWTDRQVPRTVLSDDQCRKTKPRFLQRCGSGTLVYASVPVQNKVCSIYRDDEIRVRLQFDERERLVQMQTEMNPFKSLPIPFVGLTLHWGR